MRTRFKSSSGMKAHILSNVDTDEDEDTDDQAQWNTEALRCQLWVRQVLSTYFSVHSKASISILPDQNLLISRLARGLSFSGSQDGDHDNVKGARGGQWSAAVIASSFNLLADVLKHSDRGPLKLLVIFLSHHL